jgi:hypothetical protein
MQMIDLERAGAIECHADAPRRLIDFDFDLVSAIANRGAHAEKPVGKTVSRARSKFHRLAFFLLR